MADYLNLALSEAETRKMSSLGLAHIGDAVFELMVRTWMCAHGRSTARNLHRASVKFVSAAAQASAMEKLLPYLTKTEREVYIRGRNAHVNTVPRNASYGEYHAATGFEALFGWLYLRGDAARVNDLFELTMDVEAEKSEKEFAGEV
ncbi:MAG: ribonuclease III [Oscillospiraceae bacterium]|jgi:ribonuclease-3 family protein|nr:ribonuclease III [Oscillospiraceae bacterium]